jgi:catalase-peroxidase
MVLSGNVALEDMGFKTIGFAGGRADSWEPDIVFWGPERSGSTISAAMARATSRAAGRHADGPDLRQSRGAERQPRSAGRCRRHPPRLQPHGHVRRGNRRLIAGGHTFGKAHGAHKPDECVGADPAAAPIEQQGLGWANKCGKGNAEDTVSSGLEGAWSADPVHFTTQYLDNLYAFTG